MRALASGPLGVLVMVAPLVAIPILSTFGIPQFAPLVASPGDADAEVDIVPTLPDEPAAELQPTTQRVLSSRSADDLFAPLGDAPLAGNGVPETIQDSSQELAGGLVPLVPPDRPRQQAMQQSPRRASDSSQRALQGWDIIPDEGTHTPGPVELAPDSAGEIPQLSAVAEPEGPLSQGSTLRLPGNQSPELVPAEVPPLAMPGDGGLTWKGAQQQLNDRGVRQFYLKSMADGRFEFRCALSDPHNPQVDRQFVTSAEEPLAAVEKALHQIEDWQASQ